MSGRSLTFGLAIIWLVLLAFPSRAENVPIAPDEIPGVTKVDAEDVIELAGKIPNLTIIDARIRQDRTQGFIEDSVSLPDVDTDCESLARIIPGKSSPVLFYCNGVKCGRSAKSSRQALACGYSRIYWFRGGFEEWKEKNYPFVKE